MTQDDKTFPWHGALTGLGFLGFLGEERTELTMGERGQWLALSLSSAHFFDLDARRVTRIPGFQAIEFVTDPGRSLRSLDVCRVGERGEWTMHPMDGDELTQFSWHISTCIVKIARVDGLTRILPRVQSLLADRNPLVGP